MSKVISVIERSQDLSDATHENARLNDTVAYLRNEVSRLAIALTTLDALRISLMEPKVILIDLEKDLTPRETAILLRIMAGDSTAQIGKRFYVSISTVKTHIQRIYIKLGVHNRGGAVYSGFHLGLDPNSTEDAVSTYIERTNHV